MNSQQRHSKLQMVLSLVDQSPLYTSRSYWNSQEIEEAGAIVTSEQLHEAIHALLGVAAEEFTRNSLASMVTAAMPKKQFEWMVECNLQCPRSLAATLLYNQFHPDWRDQIVKIRKLTLIVGGRKSVIPWRSKPGSIKAFLTPSWKSLKKRKAADISCSSRIQKSLTNESCSF